MAEPETIQRLRFLMRSGSSFTIDGVTDWSMSHLENRVVKLRLVQKTDEGFTRLIVDSIDLSQIEAVLLLPPGSEIV